jgi:hypothetical protein
VFGDGRSWATQVKEPGISEAANVEAWDMPSLIDLCPAGRVDLLKIDIEGSERALFSSGTKEWLDRVRMVCIEVHGAECQEAVSSALAAYEFSASRTGEYQIFHGLARRAMSPTA